MASIEGKGKKVLFRTRTAIDFDPTLKILHSQKEVDEYLARYGVRLSLNVKVEWCPVETDYTVTPKTGGVYLYPHILDLGMKFPLMSFVRDLLCHFKVAPFAVDDGGWRVVLGFEALCDLFTPDSHGIIDFFVPFMMRKTKENGHFFAAQSGIERSIVNLADSDHGWCETIIRVFGAWDAAAQKDRGVFPMAWHQRVLQHSGVSVMMKV